MTEPFDSEEERRELFKNFYTSIGYNNAMPEEVCNAVNALYIHNIGVGRLPEWIKQDERLMEMGQKALNVHGTTYAKHKTMKFQPSQENKMAAEIRSLKKELHGQTKMIKELTEEVAKMRQQQVDEMKEMKQMVMFVAGHQLFKKAGVPLLKRPRSSLDSDDRIPFARRLASPLIDLEMPPSPKLNKISLDE